MYRWSATIFCMDQIFSIVFWSFGIAVVLSLFSLGAGLILAGWDAVVAYVGRYFLLQLAILTSIICTVVLSRNRFRQGKE